MSKRYIKKNDTPKNIIKTHSKKRKQNLKKKQTPITTPEDDLRNGRKCLGSYVAPSLPSWRRKNNKNTWMSSHKKFQKKTIRSL